MSAATRIAILVLAAGLGGCLERDITITSEPPGAIVYLNSVDVGRTPVTTPYKWHGDYEIILELPGYQTLHTHANINCPPREMIPLDLITDLAPQTYEDHRYLHYKLEKLVLPDESEILRRAEELRAKNLQPVR